MQTFASRANECVGAFCSRKSRSRPTNEDVQEVKNKELILAEPWGFAPIRVNDLEQNLESEDLNAVADENYSESGQMLPALHVTVKNELPRYVKIIPDSFSAADVVANENNQNFQEDADAENFVGAADDQVFADESSEIQDEAYQSESQGQYSVSVEGEQVRELHHVQDEAPEVESRGIGNELFASRRRQVEGSFLSKKMKKYSLPSWKMLDVKPQKRVAFIKGSRAAFIKDFKKDLEAMVRNNAKMSQYEFYKAYGTIWEEREHEVDRANDLLSNSELLNAEANEKFLTMIPSLEAQYYKMRV